MRWGTAKDRRGSRQASRRWRNFLNDIFKNEPWEQKFLRLFYVEKGVSGILQKTAFCDVYVIWDKEGLFLTDFLISWTGNDFAKGFALQDGGFIVCLRQENERKGNGDAETKKMGDWHSAVYRGGAYRNPGWCGKGWEG